MTTVPQVRVALLGTSFMGRAHARALHLLPTLEDAPAALAVPVAVCGRDPERREALRRRYGFARAVERWQDLLGDDVDALDITATNDLHAAPAIAAARAGTHVLCEKPLARDADEARSMLDAATAAGIVHMCAFTYRFYPAVRLARELVEAGELGAVRAFRSRFLLGSADRTTWRFARAAAGSGVVGDILAHHVDLLRYLAGEPVAATAVARGWDGAEVEDAVSCALELAAGGVATLEAARDLPGQLLVSTIEVDGTRGSLRFDVQRLNELDVATGDGWRTIHVTEPGHPWAELWWPRGQGLGWGDAFVHQLRHFVGAAAGAWPVAPHGATFADGARCAAICDAVLAAAASGRRVPIPAPDPGARS